MNNKTQIAKSIAFIALLIFVAVGWRILNFNYQFAPNLEIVTAASVLAAVTLGIYASITVSLFSMIISDMIIGNTDIFIFTWSAFVIIGISAVLLKKLNKTAKKQIVYSVGFAAIASFMFFAITNFGVWAQGWYPQNFAGLMESYTMALPFYKTTLIGNLILVPAVISAWQLVKNYQAVKVLVINTFVR